MNITVIVLLAATAVIGTGLWYVVDRHRDEVSTAGTVLAAIVPTLLLAATGVLALGDTEAAGNELRVATALAVAAAIPGGGLLASAVLRLADRRINADDDDSPAPPPPPPPSAASVRLPPPPPPPRLQTVSDPETLRGGATIGALERVAVAVTLLAGWPEGLALILAIKGFGRYPELRRPAAPERFIIGTFTSILWAVAAAGVIVAFRA